MLRQTINVLEQQKSLNCMMMLPKIIISNVNQEQASSVNNATASISQQPITQNIPKFDWSPVKYNFNYQLLQSEYAAYCKQYNIINKFEKKISKQDNLNSGEKCTINPTQQQVQNSYLQTVLFNPSYSLNAFPIVSNQSNNIIYEMANKRTKQAKKKRSKRKNGGHQSIRC